jgi:hypothetical protein
MGVAFLQYYSKYEPSKLQGLLKPEMTARLIEGLSQGFEYLFVKDSQSNLYQFDPTLSSVPITGNKVLTLIYEPISGRIYEKPKN